MPRYIEDRPDRGFYYEPPRYIPPPGPLPIGRGYYSGGPIGLVGRIADAAYGSDDPYYYVGRRPRGLVTGLLGAALSRG